MQQIFVGLLLMSLSVWASSVSAAEQWRWSVGVDYLSGDYGSNVTTDIKAITFATRYKQDRITLKASLPYLSIDNAGVTLDGVPVAGGGSNKQGIGDLNLSASYLGYYAKESGLGFSGKLKVKVPLADEDKGLGTGEMDISAQIDPFWLSGNTTLFSTIGYKVYGDTATTDYNNVWYLTLGGMYKIRNDIDIGMGGNLREKVTDTGEGKRDLFLFVNNKLDKNNALQFHMAHGFSDASPDWAGGLVFKRNF